MKVNFFKVIFSLSLFFIFFYVPNVFAQEAKQVVLVNPIRGNDFWNHNFSLLDTPKKQYELIKKNNFPASWLVRYDGLANKEIQDFLKNLDSSQDVGIFFEITPTLTRDAGVFYNQSSNWHQAKSVLLTGYSPEDRIKLIDTAVGKYKEIFGKNPKSAGAWWIDAYSLGYMKEKYGIEANLDVADQYSTDGYQVWGQYWSTPFYPSKSNALMPAQSKEQKLDIVTMQWATRDPYNGYGNGVFESTYSVQANDYMLHNLDTNYFSKLLGFYPQTTVGLENDFSWAEFGNEYASQLQVIKEKLDKRQIGVKNMALFAKTYMDQNPGISPNVLIFADDPLGGEGKVLWVNTPRFRAGWFTNARGSVIRDLRMFNDRSEENCLHKACDELKLAFESAHVVDDGNYSSNWILDEGTVSDVRIKTIPGGAQINYKNQSGTERILKFLENDIEFAGQINTLEVAILKAKTIEQFTKPEKETFESKFDFNLNIPKIIGNLLKFILLTLLFFIIPGFALTKSKVLAIPAGISVFTILVWILGFIKLDFLIWALPIVSGLAIFKQGLPIILPPKLTKENIILYSLIFLGSFSWLLTQVKNGLLFNYGLGFWGPNGHDAVWHLSLISSLQKNVPPQNPIFAGEALSNYHYFFDLLLAKSSNIFSIDPSELLFRLFPALVSIAAGFLIFKVTKKISGSAKASIFAAFFLYFGGSFGWIITYLSDKSFGGETMFWAQQAISTLLNPPFAISIIIFLAGLLIFYQIMEKDKKPLRMILALTILWGSLIEFKAYAGVLTLGSLGFYSLQQLIFKKEFKLLLIFLCVLIFSLAVFLPNNINSTSLIEFKPFWLIESMVNAKDRLGWERLTLTMQSGVWFKLIYGYSLGILIFLAGNLGTRIISIAAVKDFFKQSFLAYFVIFSIILPLLFIQKGTSWNIVQFFYYAILVLNIFAGIALFNFSKKMPKIIAAILIIFIMLITIPTTLGTFPHYLPNRPPAKISKSEIEALNFLKNQPQGIVLTLPFDEKIKNKFNTPLPLETYTSTAYVSGFSGQSAFLEDTINLEILGVDYKGRLNTVKDFMKIKSQSKKILKENNITYVYIPKLFNFQVDEEIMGIKTIFENDEVKIYKAV